VLDQFDDWTADQGTEWAAGPFTIDLAPDWLHKANVSGGSPYGVAIPNDGVDALLLFEPHLTTFVNYLRIAFRWAGMPGWNRPTTPTWVAPPTPPPAELRDIAARLLPL
jgi:hypothetical protein